MHKREEGVIGKTPDAGRPSVVFTLSCFKEEKIINKKETFPAAAAAAEEDNGSAVSSLTGDSASLSGREQAPGEQQSTRFIGETAGSITMMEKFMVCPLCTCKVSVSITSKGYGLATVTRIQCTDKTCTFVYVDKPAPAEVPLPDDAGSEKIKRNTDHAINVLYMLGFMASGDGGTEAARVLGLLGLPNATTMQSRTFSAVERQIGPVIQSIADEVIVGNLKKEVRN